MATLSQELQNLSVADLFCMREYVFNEGAFSNDSDLIEIIDKEIERRIDLIRRLETKQNL